MTEHYATEPRIHLRTYLAAWYALFIVYGSLSPFSDWQEQGLDFFDVLVSSLKLTYTWFDMMTNLLAYLPFGLLLGLALRTRFGGIPSLLLATLGGFALSAAMEYAQMYLPSRVSSNMDLLSNTLGTLAGALLGTLIAPRAWFALHLKQFRYRLFLPHAGRDFGLAIIALWIFAQTNPSLPMLGNVFITEVARAPFEAVQAEPLNFLEAAAVSLNLLMLGLLMLTLLRHRRHAVSALMLVLCLVALAKFLVAVTLLKSWALLLWLNSEAMFGILVGALLMFGASWMPRPHLVPLAAFVALAYLVLAHLILGSGSPAAAMRLYQWSYGHLLNYNGLSQTIALIFPFLLLGYLWRMRRQRGATV